jgi:hypothetical protein
MLLLRIMIFRLMLCDVVRMGIVTGYSACVGSKVYKHTKAVYCSLHLRNQFPSFTKRQKNPPGSRRRLANNDATCVLYSIACFNKFLLRPAV